MTFVLDVLLANNLSALSEGLLLIQLTLGSSRSASSSNALIHLLGNFVSSRHEIIKLQCFLPYKYVIFDYYSNEKNATYEDMLTLLKYLKRYSNYDL